MIKNGVVTYIHNVNINLEITQNNANEKKKEKCKNEK